MTGFDKGIIQRSFSRAAASYDAFAELQREAAFELSRLIEPVREPRSILDVGCGTGELTAYLTKLFPEAMILGCDIAQPMIKQARGKLSNGNKATLFASDCEELPLRANSVDLVTAGLVFQWAAGLERAFTEASRVLRPGGELYLTTLGPHTLKELKTSIRESVSGKDELPTLMNFTENTVLTNTLNDAGFNVTLNISDMRKKGYANMWALLRTLKNIGAANPFPNPRRSLARGGILKEAATFYERTFSKDGSIYATYELQFIIAVKP